MNRKSVCVAVTGAAGHIGYAMLFRIASGQVFGENTDVHLRLLELEAALPALNGVAMELDDCAFPLLKSVTCTSDLHTAFDGANWALLVGSVPRKQGMERSDLLAVNGSIFTAQGKAINDCAADDVRVLVVGNPCNTNCLIAMRNAPDVPEHRFHALTMLDELRAKTQLAQKANVSVDQVSNMTIWGNHSATQYPDFYNALIAGKPAPEVIGDHAWFEDTFIPTVQQRGAAIIKARGASSAASAANGAISGVKSLITDTIEGDSFSMCIPSSGEYGVEPGLIFSFPCRVVDGELEVVEGIIHGEYGQQKVDATLAELQSERDTVKAKDLI